MNQQFKMLKPMLDMQRASAEGMLNSLTVLWDQTAIFFDGATWLPEEGRKQLRQWVDINKKACEGLKSAVDGGYSSLEKFFSEARRQEKADESTKAATEIGAASKPKRTGIPKKKSV
ncbi:MAG: hypothetical protein ABSF90_31025 [Syntrophobacteraceae bacterium]|jgi:septum formation inhibitor MinC